jgi:hypothetical protein
MVTDLATTKQRQTICTAAQRTVGAPASRNGREASASQGGRGSGRWRSGWLAGLVAVGILAGTGVAETPLRTQGIPLSEQALAGVWELESLAGELVGPNMSSAVLSQKVQFHNGAVTGETRLRPGTAAATTDMPFPDASATQIYTNPTTKEVTVIWDGAYRLLNDGSIEMHLGPHRTRIRARYNRVTRSLEMDHDAILTYKGGACYHAAG